MWTGGGRTGMEARRHARRGELCRCHRLDVTSPGVVSSEEVGQGYQRCVSLISEMIWLAFCRACRGPVDRAEVRRRTTDRHRHAARVAIPPASARPPFAAAPCPATPPAAPAAVAACTAVAPVHSGDAPSRSLPGSASPSWARCHERGRVTRACFPGAPAVSGPLLTHLSWMLFLTMRK